MQSLIWRHNQPLVYYSWPIVVRDIRGGGRGEKGGQIMPTSSLLPPPLPDFWRCGISGPLQLLWLLIIFPVIHSFFLQKLIVVGSLLRLHSPAIQMAYWCRKMIVGAELLISCQGLAFLSNLSHWQSIKNSVSFTILWHQCVVQIV